MPPPSPCPTRTAKTYRSPTTRAARSSSTSTPRRLPPAAPSRPATSRDNLDLLAAAGYDVIGVSPDKPEKLAKFREKENLKVTLVGDPYQGVLEAYGAFGEKKLYGKTVTGVIRSTIVVDEEGKVEHAFYNVRATGHVAKIIKDLGI